MKSVGRQIALAHKVLHARLEARLAQHGASAATWVVLSALADGGGISQRALARRMYVEGPTLTRHLDRLQDDGLVRRERDAADRRIVRVELTPEGRARQQDLTAVVRHLDADLRSMLSEAELGVVSRVMERIYETLKEGDVDVDEAG